MLPVLLNTLQQMMLLFLITSRYIVWTRKTVRCCAENDCVDQSGQMLQFALSTRFGLNAQQGPDKQ